MILTCPHCETQFTIDAALLKPKGRKVKCSSCEEVWFEKPVEEASIAEEVIEADNLDSNTAEEEQPQVDQQNDIEDDDGADAQEETEKIAEESDEAPEEEASEGVEETEQETEEKTATENPKAKLIGLFLVVLIFIGILAALFVFRAGIMRAYPNSITIYKPLGLAHHLDTDGLVFDNVKLRYDMRGTLHLTGNIVNLTAHERHIPHVQATLLDKDDKPLDAMNLDLEKTTLAPESNMAISHDFEHIDNDVENVKLNFTLTKQHTKSPSEDTAEEHVDDATEHHTEEKHDEHKPTAEPQGKAHH